MLRAVLNKFCRQHPTKHQLYSHLPPITKTIQVKRTRHAGHCWRSRDEFISDVLLWTSTYGRAKPAQTYIQQLCEDTGCSPEDLPEAWTIGRSGERESGIFVLAARHADDEVLSSVHNHQTEKWESKKSDQSIEIIVWLAAAVRPPTTHHENYPS